MTGLGCRRREGQCQLQLAKGERKGLCYKQLPTSFLLGLGGRGDTPSSLTCQSFGYVNDYGHLTAVSHSCRAKQQQHINSLPDVAPFLLRTKIRGAGRKRPPTPTHIQWNEPSGCCFDREWTIPLQPARVGLLFPLKFPSTNNTL